MTDIRIYTKSTCPYCHQAKDLLNQLKLPFTEINVDRNMALRRKLADENDGYATVPMIFINDRFVGGYSELSALHRSGRLQELL